MTPWPSALPTVSKVTGFSPYRLDGDLLKLDLNAQMITHEVPDELYLGELCELDLADDDQLLGFVNTFGRLGHPAQPVRRSDVGKLVTGSERAVIRELGVDVPDVGGLPWEEWWTEVDTGVSDMGVVEKGLFFSDGMLHLEGVRGWALAFKRLTRLYLSFQTGNASASDMQKVARVLSDLMGPFTPVLDVVYDEDAEDWSPFKDTKSAPRLENVLALQMYNHIADGDVYHVCEFDKRLFVHQRGRVEKAQHRKTGVKFCSTQCAANQAARDYRRRKKAKGQKEA